MFFVVFFYCFYNCFRGKNYFVFLLFYFFRKLFSHIFFTYLFSFPRADVAKLGPWPSRSFRAKSARIAEFLIFRPFCEFWGLQNGQKLKNSKIRLFYVLLCFAYTVFFVRNYLGVEPSQFLKKRPLETSKFFKGFLFSDGKILLCGRTG